MSKLQEKRQAAGFSQRTLALMSGVSIRTLQYYEQGALDINKASAATVYRLAFALGCHMEELLDLECILKLDAE
jgi:transcriptional regulator with XRE-family HTH domain